MYIRYAFFEGVVNDEDQQNFDNHVQNEMLPLIRNFPGLISVRVLRPGMIEDQLPKAYMILEMSYASPADMEQALKSPERELNKQKTEQILPLLKNGVVRHMTAWA